MLPSLLLLLVRPTTLAVGDEKPFARIEDAVKAAQAGDEIDVYPKAGGYPATAVMVRTPGLTIVGKTQKIPLDGGDFEYSGVGSIPRAIFQIDPAGDGTTIENFELRGAHNKSYNGAGIRINQASKVTIKDCDIHANDMGIMSGGVDGNSHAAEDQLIDHCTIHGNGNLADPGYNHNLYLGGTSVTVQFCAIDHSLTGHNLKTRAHFTLVQYCVIAASANRELDFVDAWDTRRPNSNAVLIGNVIAKDPDCPGNKTVINFGQENGSRKGTIYLINNTIKTSFLSAIVDLTSPDVEARFVDNLIENTSQAHPLLVAVSKGATLDKVAGASNVISPAYDVAGTRIDPHTLYTDPRHSLPPGEDRPRLPFDPTRATYMDGNGVRHDVKIEYRHSPKRGWYKPTAPSIGAGD
jgi:hypothetical protein